MAPQVVDNGNMENVDRKIAMKALQLNNLRKEIPEEAFKKSVWKGIYYMLVDYAMWAASVFAIYSLTHSETWTTMPYWQQVVASVIYWNVSGFLMWCIFITGHDCGHGTFADSELVNDIFGHISHGSIMVPFYSWQLSHRRHHMYHNHIDKDYSHPWYTPDRLEREDEGAARLVHSWSILRFLFPLYGWAIYLYGMPDGSHFIPWSSQRIWKESPASEYTRCIISTVSCIAWLGAIYVACGQDLMNLAYYYGASWIMLGWWLVSVTYLQHHNPETLVYDDDDWKFVDAAFETVDRTFGFGIDTLHHHITDGHVAHHLFFTKIPHYNLPIATKAIKSYMIKSGLGWMYKSENTYDFVYRTHKYFMDFGFKSHRAPKANAPAAAAVAAAVNKKEE